MYTGQDINAGTENLVFSGFKGNIEIAFSLNIFTCKIIFYI